MPVRSLLFIVLNLLPCILFAQWAQITSAPGVYYRDIMNSNGELYVSSAGSGVYKSTDNGGTWLPINNGLTSQQALDTYQTVNISGILFVATTDGIYKSTDDGGIWVKKSNGITIGPGALYAFTESIFEYNGVLFTGAWNGIYFSTNGAESWDQTNIMGEGVLAKNFTEHDGILFAARESINSPIGYKSFDGGFTWQDLTGLSFFNTITFLSEPGYLWAGIVGGVWLSTDDGITWEDRSNGLSSDPYSSSILRVNGTLVTSLKFGGSGVYSSTDDGLNWMDITNGLPFLASIDKLILYNEKIIAATSEGLWEKDLSEIPVELVSFNAEYTGSTVRIIWLTATETNNRGFEIQRKVSNPQNSIATQWKKIGFVEGAGTVTEQRSYTFTDMNISAGVYEYRLKQIDLNGTYAYSNEIDVDVKAPADYSLEQNYPNPFNPSTQINYSIPLAQKVILKVFDILGNEVATLVNQNQSAGNYSVEFSAEGGSASGENASKLTSGVYFYSLQASGMNGSKFSSVRKMILLK
ncbi:MAG TPA: T9SS type A sorting domain-containing protein [Ignavibacteriaceae bacterium]|nr:T9SS type A sorting domain-containing protein [Ignavibacteriaceae bacterium]